jgi:DNA polymerase-1
MSEKKVMVIDGNNYFTRMFYSVDRTKENYLEEIINRFLAFREKYSDKRLIFTFDTCKSARRLELFPEYKMKRSENVGEEERRERLEGVIFFMNVIKYCGFVVLEGNGYEADDYIACVVAMLKPRNQVVIVSTDKDLWQLVDMNVRVYDPIKMIYIEQDNFKFVVEVEQKYYLDFKCMVGDDSDEIPGVKSIGPKTALKFIEEYGHLQDILNGINKKEKKSEKEKTLLDGIDILNRNRKLMSLKIPINDERLQEIIKKVIGGGVKTDKENLHKLLGMKSLGCLYKNILRSCFV